MIAVLLVLAVASDVTCRSVIGFTPSPTSVALVESVTEGVTSSPTESPLYLYDDAEGATSSPTHEFHPDYLDCNGFLSFIGDGNCDSSNNNAECGWDGGDCCEYTCQSTASYNCGDGGYDCKGPSAQLLFEINDCGNISLPILKASTCPQDVQFEWVVNDTATAKSLAEVILCSGGNFEVEWRGHINVTTTIYVNDGASLRITGASDAIADGGGTVQVLIVSNGSLYLKNFEIVNGNASDGGAICAASGSELFVEGVSFSSNMAEYMGGAIYAVSSNITLVSTAFNYNIAGYGGAIFADNSIVIGSVNADFHGNGADYGGAVFVLSSIVIGSGNVTLTSNNATENGGALYIADSSYFGWNIQHVFDSTSQYYWLDDESSSRSLNLSFTSSSYFADNTYSYWNDAEWIYSVDIGDTTTVLMDNIAEGVGGAIYANDSEISWSGSILLKQNSAQYGGALYLGDYASFETKGMTSFYSNRALYDGGAIGAADDAGTISDHSWLTLNGSTNFTRNTCGGNGGAIDLSEIRVDVYGKIAFSANSAASSGGALYASQKKYGPTLTGVIFSNNTAEAGGAVFFSAVGIDEDDSSNGDEISYYSWSKFIECRFDGNSASSTGGAIHSIAGNDLVWGTDFTNNMADLGGALRVYGITVILNSSFVENKSGDEGGPAISNRGVILNMRSLIFSGNGYQCSADDFKDLDEIRADQSRYDTVCDGCGAQEKCLRCIVKDSNHIPVCSEVIDHTDNQDGTATLETLVLEAGYWRTSKSSRQIMACFKKDACRGGLTGNPDYCSTGYEGPYCAVCSQGYASTLSNYGCRKCSEAVSIASSVCAVAIVGIVGLLFVRHMISIEGHRTTWISVNQIKIVLPSQSFKIIIVSWQIVTQFSSVANVVYPRLYQRLLNVITLANFDLGWIPSAACIMGVDFYVELIAATVGPLILVALLGLTYTIALHRNRGSERALSAVRRKHANATIVIALLLYSMASSAVFRTFACDHLDDGKVYLRSDYRIECNSLKHKAFQIYAAFMLVVYPLGIPTTFALLLFQIRKALLNTSLPNDTSDLLHQSTSNLWKPYKPSAFYYEVLECGRRVILTVVVIFIYPNTPAQVAITLAIACIFAFTSARLDPYDSHWDAWVSRIGHFIVVLTIYLALLANIDVSNEGGSPQLLTGVLVAAHIAMLLVLVAEAIVLVFSVRQRDSPLPITRTSCITPLDVSSIQSCPIDSRGSHHKDSGTNPS